MLPKAKLLAEKVPTAIRLPAVSAARLVMRLGSALPALLAQRSVPCTSYTATKTQAVKSPLPGQLRVALPKFSTGLENSPPIATRGGEVGITIAAYTSSLRLPVPLRAHSQLGVCPYRGSK
jgi:hypothetical protein